MAEVKAVQPETQNMPVTGDLQPPAPTAPVSVTPPPAAAPAPAVQPGSSFRHLAPAMIGAILGHAAGPAPSRYTTDANGRIVTLPAAPESTSDKIRRIAAHALTGLAASSGQPEQKSGLANALAGAGEGAKGVTEQQERQDALSRAKAKEDFEQEQKTMLQRHQIMVGNTTAIRNLIEARKLQIDSDPERQAGIALADAAKQANIPGAEVISDAEWQARIDASDDKEHFLATHSHFPAGFSTPEMSPDGQLLKEGSGQVAIIPTTADGKLALPQQFLDQMKKYATLSGRVTKQDLDNLPAGHEIDVKQLPAMRLATEEGRNIWLKGESTPTLSYPTGKDGQPDLDHPTLINSVTREPIQALKAGEVSSQAVEEQAKRKVEAAKEELQQGENRKNLAQAALAWQQVSDLKGGDPNDPAKKAALDGVYKAYSSLPPLAQGVLKNLKPEDQAALMQLWAGKVSPNDWSKMLRKGVNDINLRKGEALIGLFDPSWKSSKFEEVKKLEEKYQDPSNKLGGAIVANGQFLRHAAEAKEISDEFSRTSAPVLNMTMNEARKYLGGKGAPMLGRLEVALTGASNEWENLIKSGHAQTAEESKQRALLADPATNIGTLAAVLYQMGSQGLDRLDETDQPYRTVTGQHYPGILSQPARDAAVKLGLGDRLKDYGEPGTVFTGPSPTTPNPLPNNKPPAEAKGVAPGSDGKFYYHDAQGKILGEAPNPNAPR